jgi:hypothetical protein
METPDEQKFNPKRFEVVSFTLPAAAHMLRTVNAANTAIKLLREVAPLLENGTIIFGNRDLPVRVKALLAEAEQIDKEVPNDSGN